ncbi:MAG: tyramine oxidase [Pseudomonadota bacterium]
MILRRTILALVALTFLNSATAAVKHPLDGLQADEYLAVRDILVASGDADDQTLFAMIRLDEPPKSDVLAWTEGEEFPRVAWVVLRKGKRLFEARVDLRSGKPLSVAEVDDAQSSILYSEFVSVEEIVEAHPGWREAIRKRGYEQINPDQFMCLPLAAGYFAEPEFEGRRIVRAQCFDLKDTGKNLFQRPISGLTLVVDLNEKTVLKLVDDGPVPVPEPDSNYDEESLKPYKPAMKPIEITLPEGPTYSFDGSFVDWGPWRFHLRLDRRRGVIVSLASFEDRSVLYQASLSEMWVPYMDPAYGWFYKNYFDAGEYGFGMFATQLTPGVDCPRHASFHDHAMGLDDAEPQPFPGALCIFERPTMDPAWRHFEGMDGSFAGRPGRELVVRMIAAIGNYDYVFDYIFMPTGAVTLSIASTGLDITKAVPSKSMSDDTAAEDTRYGTLIAPNRIGVFHDHFFSLRFDLDVDGQVNHFVRDRIVTKSLPSDHPRSSLWTVESQRARSEAAAQLDISIEEPEQWRVESADRKNALGYPTGYAVSWSSNALSLLSRDDYPLRRAGFARHHLWVTPYDPAELFSAGKYPNQSRGGDGLPAWTAENRSIEETDVVLWYTLGFHHITAAEDWPVLPSHPKSVTLRPFNFFDRSPVINLAPPR